MKIFAISDLHLSDGSKPMDIFGASWGDYIDEIKRDWKEKVTDDDIVLMSGDLSWAMKLSDLDISLSQVSDLPGRVIIIRGNHDYWWKSISAVNDALPSKWHALQNDAIKIGDVIFCGNRGWSVADKSKSEEDEKLLAREVIRTDLSLSDAKRLQTGNEKIVAMIHYPPFNARYESTPLTDLFEKYQVSAVVYGHLHGNDARADSIVRKNGIVYYLTSCDLVKNKLVEIKI